MWHVLVTLQKVHLSIYITFECITILYEQERLIEASIRWWEEQRRTADDDCNDAMLYRVDDGFWEERERGGNGRGEYKTAEMCRWPPI